MFVCVIYTPHTYIGLAGFRVSHELSRRERDTHTLVHTHTHIHTHLHTHARTQIHTNTHTMYIYPYTYIVYIYIYADPAGFVTDPETGEGVELCAGGARRRHFFSKFNLCRLNLD